jgi:hypothetical protein
VPEKKVSVMTSHAENVHHGVIRSRLVLLAALCLMMFLGGCASTSLVNQWKNPTVPPRPYQKFLVVGIANDITLRRAFENLLSEDLEKAGVTSVKLISYFPQDQLPSKDLVKAVVAECGADGVITTRPVSVRNETTYVDGFYQFGYVEGGAEATSPGSDFYMFYSGFVAAPMAQDMQTAILETRLFDAKSGTLVWAATTRTYDSDNRFKLIQDVAKLLTTTLRKQGYLPARGTP